MDEESRRQECEAKARDVVAKLQDGMEACSIPTPKGPIEVTTDLLGVRVSFDGVFNKSGMPVDDAGTRILGALLSSGWTGDEAVESETTSPPPAGFSDEFRAWWKEDTGVDPGLGLPTDEEPGYPPKEMTDAAEAFEAGRAFSVR